MVTPHKHRGKRNQKAREVRLIAGTGKVRSQDKVYCNQLCLRINSSRKAALTSKALRALRDSKQR